ncbi:MAG: TlpA disulfide reductase family protein [Pseudomonadota bacterium]
MTMPLLVAGAVSLIVSVAMPKTVQAAGQVFEEAQAALIGELENFVLHDEPKPLPPLAITDEAGNPVDFADFEGRVVLLNIWATWCRPCIAEMPSLNALQARAAGSEFDVVPLSLDRGPVVVQQFYKDYNLKNLLIFMDEDDAAVANLEVGGLPTSILVDHNGYEVGRLTGDADWNADEVIKLIGAYVRDARRAGDS